APAVVEVPDRRGKFENVDIVAFESILENRPVIDDYRRNMFGRFLIVIEECVAQLLLGEPLREAERHGAPLAGKTIDQQAKPFGATGYFVEKHRRPVVRRN